MSVNCYKYSIYFEKVQYEILSVKIDIIFMRSDFIHIQSSLVIPAKGNKNRLSSQIALLLTL